VSVRKTHGSVFEQFDDDFPVIKSRVNVGNGRSLVVSGVNPERDPAEAHASHAAIINLTIGFIKRSKRKK
jgi:hypothetical protein